MRPPAPIQPILCRLKSDAMVSLSLRCSLESSSRMTEALQPLYFPELPPELRPIMEAFYPRFSPNEMQRRRAMLQELMKAAGVEHLMLYGANRAGNAIQYFTHWTATTEAACIVSAGTRD